MCTVRAIEGAFRRVWRLWCWGERRSRQPVLRVTGAGLAAGHHASGDPRRPYNEDLPDGPMRELIFGPNSEAAVTYLIVEHSREVHILVVQWLG